MLVTRTESQKRSPSSSKVIAFFISAIAQSLLAKGQSWYWLLPVGKLDSTFQSLLRIFFNHKLVSEVDAA
ncbi:hypothetical protein [uncultured Nostoc sp.]|uniref:hypothetical protein n=1 Tax=uncultured Nostoc sp. TaxID=340711 RepID=UPI002632F4A7|nr:hypothetical protein [uncultured Nostoc sp.]